MPVGARGRQLTRCCAPQSCPLPPREALEIARLCKALSDPTRIEMLGILARCQAEMNVCDIEDCFDLGQPTVSHHLKVLREAGLVETERQGQCICYRVDTRSLARLRHFLDTLE